MQKLLIYRENTNNGIGVGEDAYPFVNENGMFVADGIGGSAGVRVNKCIPEVFNEDEFFDWMFKEGLIEENIETDFKEYYKNSFSSILNDFTKEVYTTNTENRLDNYKKSGYFGSHILGITMVRLLLSKNTEIRDWKKSIIYNINNIYDTYKKIINMMKLDCILPTVTSHDYLDMYGSTLSGCFFKENEEDVEVIFVNCGDSRCYVLDESGFRLAVEDQGHKGRMTNYICTNKEDKSIISHNNEVKVYKKPCIFFCMTDGIYDAFYGENGFQATPLIMEKKIINALSKGLESGREELTSFLNTFSSRIDDSGSLVMSAFGFDNESNFVQFIDKRNAYLNSFSDDSLLKNYKSHIEEIVINTYTNNPQGFISMEVVSDYFISREKEKNEKLINELKEKNNEIEDKFKKNNGKNRTKSVNNSEDCNRVIKLLYESIRNGDLSEYGENEKEIEENLKEKLLFSVEKSFQTDIKLLVDYIKNIKHMNRIENINSSDFLNIEKVTERDIREMTMCFLNDGQKSQLFIDALCTVIDNDLKEELEKAWENYKYQKKLFTAYLKIYCKDLDSSKYDEYLEYGWH